MKCDGCRKKKATTTVHFPTTGTARHLCKGCFYRFKQAQKKARDLVTAGFDPAKYVTP